MTTLDDTLAQFDGKATSLLSEARVTFGSSPTFVDDLIRLTRSDDAQVSAAATWLIKDLLDDVMRLTEAQTRDLLGSLHRLTDWQSQLHICQSFQFLEVPATLAPVCADWLTALLESDRPFLRAWSMDALQHLAIHSKELKERAAAARQAAENDPAASVRARARRWTQ